MSKREAGTIFISLQLATEEMQAGIRTLDQQFKKIGATAQQLGQRLSLAFSAPLLGIATYAVKSFGDFDQAMTNSLAIMGKVSDSMKKELVAGAMEVAATTTFSAKQAAEGYYELASAGLSAEQSLKALPIVADFATAGQMKLAEATLTLTRIQSALGLTMKDPIENMKEMTRVSDVIGKASIDTTLHISDLAASLSSQLGGALRQSHTSLETATALLEAFGSQGIVASKAGTALGIVVRELGVDFLKHSDAFRKAGIEVFNAKGQYNNIIDTIGSLEKRFKGMSDAQKLAQLLQLGFTKRNAQFIQSLIGMTAQMKIWEKNNLSASGSIKTIANTMRTGFNSQMIMAKNNLQNVAIVIGSDLAPFILMATQALARFAQIFIAIPTPIRHVVEGFLALVAAVGPLQYLWGVFASGLSAIFGLVGKFIGIITSAATAIVSFGASIGLIPILAGAAFIAAGVAAYIFWDDIKKYAASFVDWISSTFPNVGVVLQAAWILIKSAAAETWSVITTLASEAVAKIASFGEIVAKIFSQTWSFATQYAVDFWGGSSKMVLAFITYFSQAFPQISEFAGKVWEGIKESATKAFDSIRETIKDLIGWIGKIFDKLAEAKNWVVGKSKEIVSEAARNDASQAIADQAKAQLDANNQVGQSAGLLQTVTDLYGKVKDAIAGATISTKDHAAATSDLTGNLNSEGESLAETLKGFEKVDKAAQKAAKAMRTLELAKNAATGKAEGAELDIQITDAVKALNNIKFDELQQNLANSIMAANKEAYADTVATIKAGQGAIAASRAEAEVEAIGSAKVARAQAKNAQEWEKELVHAHERAADSFREVFKTAFQKGGLDWKAAFQDLLIDFGSELAATVSGGITEGGKLGMKSVGTALGQVISEALGGSSNQSVTGSVGGSGGGGFLGSIIGSIRGMFSGNPQPGDPNFIGPTIPQPGDANFQGPVQPGGGGISSASIANGIQSGIITLGAILNAHGTDKKNKDNSGTGGAIGAAAGSYWGPIGTQVGQIAGSFIGSLFKWGAQNPETKARHAFANFIEDGFKKLSTVAFFDAKGKLKTMNAKGVNFLQGDSGQFNNSNWADQLNSLGAKARGTFLGLGDAMKETLGLTDAVGSHLALMLAQNLGGSVDNARLLVQQLGLSMDDMITKLVEVGVQGGKSWLEIETDIQGVTEAFKPGLVAVGDVKGAFQELVDSGGRGMAALKGVKDIAVEALEAGAKTLADLKGKLIADGTNPADVDALMAALRQRGITTLQQLADVSNRVGGGIVADINASSKSMADNWAKMSSELEDVSKKLTDLPTAIESNITLNVDANVSDSAQQVLDSPVGASIDLPAGNTKKFAKGAFFGRAMSFSMPGGMGIAGEHAPGEFLMPAARLPDGSMGVRAMGGQRSGSMVNITVNAPGAAPGMEHRIVDAIKQIQGQIIAQTVDVVERRSSRGGRYG